MAKRNIGATLSIKDGNFTTGIRNAITSIKNLKNHTTNATGNLKKMNTQCKSTGDTLAGLAKKVAGVGAAYAGFSQAKAFVTDCVTGVMELERANERLSTLMMNVQGTTQAQVDEIIKYGDALELVTTIEGDATVFEKEPLEKVAEKGQLSAYKHDGFWQCMDTKREKDKLDSLWESKKAPWKIWED